MAPLDAEGRRLLWRCRRGLKELDVLLERYAEATLPHAGPTERRVLARLLELPDPELAGYLLAGAVPTDAELASLASRIRGGASVARPPCGMIGAPPPKGGTASGDI